MFVCVRACGCQDVLDLAKLREGSLVIRPEPVMHAVALALVAVDWLQEEAIH